MSLTIPSTASELEELLNDQGAMADIMADGQWAEFTRAYAKTQMEAKAGELTKQLREGTATGMQEFLRDSRETAGGSAVAGAGTPGVLAREATAARLANRSIPMVQAAARQKLYNKQAVGATLDGEDFAASMGKFLRLVRATKDKNTDTVNSFRDTTERALNAMGERVPSEGGFLVPETLRSDLLMLALETAIVRPRARIIPMESLRVPYPTIDDPSHVSNVYGGVVGYWTEEAAALTASQPTFGRIVLEAKKLTAYTEVPNELLSDSVEALDQFFSDMYPEALAFFEDTAFLSGDGVGQPQGIFNATCAVTLDRATSNLVQFADVAAMYTRMLPQSLNRAVWLCSPDVIGQLLQLVLTVSSTPVAPPLWLQSMNAAEGVQYSLLGRPLIVTEKAPALGATGDLSFVDFGYYLIGDRQSMQVANSDEYKFANDLTAFRVIERLDGRPWLRSALTPANGSTNTLSPIVTLNATAV